MNSATVSVGDTATASQYNNVRKDLLVGAGADFATTAGSANAYTLSLDAQITAYATGMIIKCKANFSNTGAATINLNSIGAKSIKRLDGSALLANDIVSGQVIILVYDGTNFQLCTVPVIGAARYSCNQSLIISGDAIGFITSDKLTLSVQNGSAIISYTRSADGAQFQYNASNSPSYTSGNALCMYTESGTQYLLSKDSSTSNFRRSSNIGASAGNITISGTAPGSYTVGVAFDPVNNYILALDGASSTTIRRYSISGTTFTNIASNITLSAAPTNAQQLIHDGTYIWLIDLVSSRYKLKKHDAAGTLLNTYDLGDNATSLSAVIFDGTDIYVAPSMRVADATYSSLIFKFNP